jgi:shikimate kinase
MGQNLILIGPAGVGKSTLGPLLATALGKAHCSLDTVRWDYFKEVGFDEQEQHRVWEAEGMDGVLRYWQPFEMHAVERVLMDYQDTVIDFGGGYTTQDDPRLLSRVQQALAPHQVVLLLPSPDLARSVQILAERTVGMLPAAFDIQAHIMRHQTTRAWADLVMYTEGMTPEATRDALLAELDRTTNRPARI